MNPLTDGEIDRNVTTDRITFGQFMGSGHGHWLMNWIRKRQKEARPINLVFTGETGSGKSYAALRVAANMDKDFSEERVVFDTAEFMKLLNSRPPAGSVIMFDEAGLGNSNMDWHDEQQVLFGKTAQSMRYRGIAVEYTVPRLPFINNTTRQLIQILFESTAIRGRMKPFFIRPAANKNDNKPWYYYPTVTYVQNFHVYMKQIRVVNFDMPKRWLYIPYEKKKDAYLTAFYEGIEEKLKADEKGTEEMEFGVMLYCSNCQNIFRYKKASWSPKCPRCNAPVTIPNDLKKYVGIQHVKLAYDYTVDPLTGQLVQKPNARVNPNPDAPDVQYIDEESPPAKIDD